jgi:hypothetical protein
MTVSDVGWLPGERKDNRRAAIEYACENGAFGPIGASWMKARFFHFVTVFGLRS